MGWAVLAQTSRGPNVARRECDLHRKHQVETLFPSGTGTRKQGGGGHEQEEHRIWHQGPPAGSFTEAEDLLIIRFFLSEPPVFSSVKWEQSLPQRVFVVI